MTKRLDTGSAPEDIQSYLISRFQYQGTVRLPFLEVP
jgi:hypothetical protein